MIDVDLGLFGLLAACVWIYAIFDVIATDDMFVRSMPKQMWLFVVIILPTVGAVAWLALGRPLNAGYRPGDTSYRPPRRVRGPEDDDSWTSRRDATCRRPRRPSMPRTASPRESDACRNEKPSSSGG